MAERGWKTWGRGFAIAPLPSKYSSRPAGEPAVTGTTSALGGGRVIEARLFPSTWKLLRLQLRIWVNGFRRGKVRDRIGRVLVLLFLGGLMVFVFFASRALLGFIRL